jgi:hypothetical protein
MADWRLMAGMRTRIDVGGIRVCLCVLWRGAGLRYAASAGRRGYGLAPGAGEDDYIVHSTVLRTHDGLCTVSCVLCTDQRHSACALLCTGPGQSTTTYT